MVRGPDATPDYAGPPATESPAAWEALGYDCSVALGHAWADAATFDAGAPPVGEPCLLTRHVTTASTEPLVGRHFATLGTDEPTAAATVCEPSQRYVVVADAAACLRGEPPASCTGAPCPARTSGRLVGPAQVEDPIVEPGAEFTHAFTVENTGSTTWSAGWLLTPLDRDDAAPRTLAQDVAPGGSTRFEVALTAPERGIDLRDDWALRASETGPALVVLPFGYDVATEDVAELGPIGGTSAAGIPPGAIGTITVTLRNRGDNAGWGADWAIVRELGTVSRAARLSLPGVLNPGEEKVIRVPAVAPHLPGTYLERWHLERPDGSIAPVDWAASFEFALRVAGPEIAVLIEESVPDGTALSPGTPFVKTWRIRNDARDPWEPGWRLVHVAGSLAVMDDLVPGTALAAGDSHLLAVPMRVPTAPAPTGEGWVDMWELRTTDGALIPVRAARETGFGPLRDELGPGWLWAEIRDFPACDAP